MFIAVDIDDTNVEVRTKTIEHDAKMTGPAEWSAWQPLHDTRIPDQYRLAALALLNLSGAMDPIAEYVQDFKFQNNKRIRTVRTQIRKVTA